MNAGIKLDFMPTKPDILSFSNRWFPAAFEHAETTQIRGSMNIRIIRATYFLATKLEAFAARGMGDYMASKDIEDVCAALQGRPEITSEVANSCEDLRAYLGQQARQLLASVDFLQALEGHLPGEDTNVLILRLRRIADGGQEFEVPSGAEAD
jgi:hypothetical protein